MKLNNNHLKKRIRLKTIQHYENKKHQRKQKCKWCGNTYTTTQHNTRYCSNECRKQADNENNRKRVEKYRKKYNKYTLGTSNIGQHKQQNTQLEIKIIQKEKNRLLR